MNLYRMTAEDRTRNTAPTDYVVARSLADVARRFPDVTQVTLVETNVTIITAAWSEGESPK